jgi:excisionase family DNA binding protein
LETYFYIKTVIDLLFVNIFCGGGMETYLTIEGLAEYLKFSEKTIRKWVLNDEVPYRKIRKAIRFRVSEIERWVDNGGLMKAIANSEAADGELINEIPEEQNDETADSGDKA